MSIDALGIGDEAYRVPKTKVGVHLTLEDGYEVKGELHVLESAPSHDGRERVVDLLSAEEPFVPVTTREGTRLVAKRRIVLVRVDERLDAGLEESDESAPELPVELELARLPAGFSTLRGRILLVMPEGQRRLLDYMNAAGRFVPVLTEQRVTLVGKPYVVALKSL